MQSYRDYKLKQLLESNVNEMDLAQTLGGTNIGGAGERAVAKTAGYVGKRMYMPIKGAAILAKNLLSIVQGDPKAEAKIKRIGYLIYKATQHPAGLMALAQEQGAESPEDTEE